MVSTPYARIKAISYALPEGYEDNAYLAAEFPEWSADKIAKKTGINRRHVAGKDEFVSHLGIAAAQRLSAEHGIDLAEIDHLIMCTQGNDFLMPVSAALVHAGLGLRPDCGANDINLGCSGYIYSLGLAKGLIDSGQANQVLVITADTYTKYLNPLDKSVRTIFGDAAAATLVTNDGDSESMSSFVYGTDGSGAQCLIVPNGGLREGSAFGDGRSSVAERGLESNGWDLYMDGPAIFNFSVRVVPECVHGVAKKAGITVEDVDLFVFHQANQFMLNHLIKKLGIPAEKSYLSMSETGNTVSSTIPIALSEAIRDGSARPGMRIMLVGFGVGLSWGGTLVRL